MADNKVSLTLVVLVLAVTGSAWRVTPDMKRNGMVYVSWSDSDYTTPQSDASLAVLANISVSSVELLVTWYQTALNSTQIQPSSFSPTVPSVVHAIEEIQALGLEVVLKPHVDCLCGAWRGDIGPQFTSEQQWTEWFSNYTSFIVGFAELAEQYNMSLFNIGTELAGTSMRTADWIDVINAIRSVYSGQLVYGSNWGAETLQVMFWSQLDYIGVDAYYPLADHPDPTVDEIIDAWQPYKAALAQFAATWQRSVIFTEIGYRSYAGAAVQPWVFTGTAPADVTAQYNLFYAMLSTVYTEDWFAGVYWWAWETSPLNGGPCDDGYNPCRKPAAMLLSQFYSENPPQSGKHPLPSALEHVFLTHTSKPKATGQNSVMIYSDGELGTGWESWSYGGVYDLQSTIDSFPSHTYSLNASSVLPNGAGAISLYNSEMIITPSSMLSFNLRTTNASVNIAIFICTCSDCTACGLAPLSIMQFVTPLQNCTLSTDSQWTNTQVNVPGVFLSFNTTSFNRITLCNANTDGTEISFAVDNVILQYE